MAVVIKQGDAYGIPLEIQLNGAALHAENPRSRTVITFDSEAFNDVHTRMEADIPEAGDMPAKKA